MMASLDLAMQRRFSIRLPDWKSDLRVIGDVANRNEAKELVEQMLPGRDAEVSNFKRDAE